jgi:flagellar basal-body rod modification protein FlgD
MDVTSTPSATTPASTQTKSSAKSSEGVAGNALTGDFNTFIRLLTAQMSNQDPLEPTSNTEFVAQLASFSSVEQQILTNDKLTALMDRMGLGGSGDVGSWIGKEVLVEGGYTRFSGDPIKVEVEPVDGSKSAILVVRDEEGVIVARKPVKNGATDLSWDGTNTQANPVEPGLYSFRLEASADDKVISTQNAKVFSEVSEVRLTENGTQLVTVGGIAVDADKVTAIR